MQDAAFEQIAIYIALRCRKLPLKFSGHTRSRPSRKGVSFVQAHVAHRLVFFYAASAREGELHPLTQRRFFPVQRRGPSAGLHDLPSVREPELGPRVTAIFNEREIFAASDQTSCQPERRDKNFVARRFIVKAEGMGHSADFTQAFSIRLRLLCDACLAHGLRYAVIRRPQRAGPERMLDVGNDQLLMLLLVIASQLNQLKRL